MYDTTLSQIYAKDMGAMQKENKRCVPKEGMPHVSACKKKRIKRCIPKEGMPHAQACQKKEEEKIAPYPKRKKKERFMTCFSFGSGI